MAGILGIPPKYCHEFITSAIPKKVAGSSRAESLANRVDRRSVLVADGRPNQTCKKLSRKYVAVGYLALDGMYYPSEEDANRVNRSVAEREKLIRRLEFKEQCRLDRLKRAAKAGDIIFTKEGVFETERCPTCDVHHKVPSTCGGSDPCPYSKLASYPSRKKTLEKVSEVSVRVFADSMFQGDAYAILPICACATPTRCEFKVNGIDCLMYRVKCINIKVISRLFRN